MPLENLQKERIKKLNNIKSLGINPYPSSAEAPAGKPARISVGMARKSIGKKVYVCGRIRSVRPHGKITFADLEDATGKIQLLFRQDPLKGEKYDLLPNLDIGDFIGVTGDVIKTNAGEITIDVDDFTILAKSLRPLPSAWYGLEDVEERYRQRYVDLIINPEVRRVFDIRHEVIRLIRKFMEDKGFVEVETPTLQPIYGGATAKPFVTHHNALDTRLYLRIADELYLKRLIVGGFEKVFEICKDFRNEGVDRQHNPEFTMIEFYWAYADYNDLIGFTEEFVSSIVKKIKGSFTVEYQGIKLNFKPPFKRITFNQLVKENCEIDLDKIKTEKELAKAIKQKGIKLDLSGVVGYGPLCDELYKKVARAKVTQPILVLDYPADMKPLSKRRADDETKSESLQLVCMDMELTNSYSELNDPILQKELWKEQMKLAKKGFEEHQVLDEDYIRALEYGMPPTAGWAIGIDRFVALLTNQHTIKDVILFPTLKPEKKKNRLPELRN